MRLQDADARRTFESGDRRTIMLPEFLSNKRKLSSVFLSKSSSSFRSVISFVSVITSSFNLPRLAALQIVSTHINAGACHAKWQLFSAFARTRNMFIMRLFLKLNSVKSFANCNFRWNRIKNYLPLAALRLSVFQPQSLIFIFVAMGGCHNSVPPQAACFTQRYEHQPSTVNLSSSNADY